MTGGSCTNHSKITPDTCASCRFSRVAKTPEGVFQKGMIECHRLPAQVQVIPVPKQGLGGIQLDVQVMSLYPTRPEGDWCGEYKE